ncbi:unnamed protein product [Caenorhabditis angaria]|uniref:C-type lectin domain-containing protein n=1 Tax=Caenorhabditis angaria TaxID=860376 RepID=A0A9P1IHK3_9PELO|nr:unnamed protein product [Caenorhabditis angaria]
MFIVCSLVVILSYLKNCHASYCEMEDTLFSVGNYTCPDNYTMVSRVKGYYCLRVIAGSENPIESETSCQLENSTLASFETTDEVNLALELSLIATNSASGYCWIGAVRQAACYGPATEFNAGCLPAAQNSFRWTDGFVTGIEAFSNFAPNRPDNYRSDQNCVGMVSSTISWGTAPGTLDDAPCNLTSGSCHVCGQPAQELN